jgi:hypothetical protein
LTWFRYFVPTPGDHNLFVTRDGFFGDAPGAGGILVRFSENHGTLPQVS